MPSIVALMVLAAGCSSDDTATESADAAGDSEPTRTDSAKAEPEASTQNIELLTFELPDGSHSISKLPNVGEPPPIPDKAEEVRIPTRSGHDIYALVTEGEDDKGTAILGHGFPDNHLLWSTVYPLLVDEGWTVVAFDFLGYGLSDKPLPGEVGADGEPFTYNLVDQWTYETSTVIEELGLTDVTLVPNDISTVPFFTYALENPETIAEVVFTNGFYTGVPGTKTATTISIMADPRLQALEDSIYQSDADVLLPWWRFQIEKFMVNEEVREPTLNRIQTLYLESRVAWHALANGVVAETTKLGESFPEGNLGQLAVPVHILWGDSDILYPVSVAETYNQVIPKSTLQLVEGAGHYLMADQPEIVAAAITGTSR